MQSAGAGTASQGLVGAGNAGKPVIKAPIRRQSVRPSVAWRGMDPLASPLLVERLRQAVPAAFKPAADTRASLVERQEVGIEVEPDGIN